MYGKQESEEEGWERVKSKEPKKNIDTNGNCQMEHEIGDVEHPGIRTAHIAVQHIADGLDRPVKGIPGCGQECITGKCFADTADMRNDIMMIDQDIIVIQIDETEPDDLSEKKQRDQCQEGYMPNSFLGERFPEGRMFVDQLQWNKDPRNNRE
jgi:hypothetical protein